MNPECQSDPQPQCLAAFAGYGESTLKLHLETRNHGDVIIIHAQGRIVYRDEAAALSRLAGEILPCARKLVLDLSGVTSMDSAGIGELVLLHTSTAAESVSFKLAGPNSLVRTLLCLTNLNTVLDIYPSVRDALEAFREDEVCADC